MPNLKEIIGDWSFMKKIDATPSNARFTPKPIIVVSEITERMRGGELISKDEFPAHLKDGRQVFLDEQSLPFVFYISDQGWYLKRRFIGYKFHFRWCSTLGAMDSQGRIKRYRAKYDICDPVFKINDGESNAQLKVCLNCCNEFYKKTRFTNFLTRTGTT